MHVSVCVCVMFVVCAMGCTVVLWNKNLGDLALLVLDRAVIPGQSATYRGVSLREDGDVVKKIRWLVLGRCCDPGVPDEIMRHGWLVLLD